MPVFQYRAVDRSGAVVTGQVQGIDRADAVAQLRADGAMPLRVRPQSAAGLVALLNTEITPRDALGTTDRIGFTRTLATLTGAGMPLDRALGSLRDLGSSRAVRALAGRLLDRVREGAALSAALAPETAPQPMLLPESDLTPRESTIGELILKGHSSLSISLLLGISVETVRVHRRNLYRKLDVASQAQLFALAIHGTAG